ncbi:MAG TPA: hypothetical protein VIU62_20590 [Chloroflexota bacterium]
MELKVHATTPGLMRDNGNGNVQAIRLDEQKQQHDAEQDCPTDNPEVPNQWPGHPGHLQFVCRPPTVVPNADVAVSEYPAKAGPRFQLQDMCRVNRYAERRIAHRECQWALSHAGSGIVVVRHGYH